MSLKMETVTSHKVDYYDLQDFIAKVYGIADFEILESANDTTHEYTNVVKKELDQYQKANIEKFVKLGGAEYYHIRTFLIDMVNKDLIPEGNYLVRVSW